MSSRSPLNTSTATTGVLVGQATSCAVDSVQPGPARSAPPASVTWNSPAAPSATVRRFASPAAAPDNESLTVIRWTLLPSAVEVRAVEPNLGPLSHRDQRSYERGGNKRAHNADPDPGSTHP